MTTDIADLKPGQREGLKQALGNRSEARQRRLERSVKSFTEMTQEEADAYMVDALSNPVSYAEKILGLDVYPKQKEILAALQRYPRVAVKGCNSSGKTYSMAMYILWALTVYDAQAVMDIAPTGNQSRHVHWNHANQTHLSLIHI